MSNLQFTDTFRKNLLTAIKSINILKYFVIIQFIALYVLAISTFLILYFIYFPTLMTGIAIAPSIVFAYSILRVSNLINKTRDALINDKQDSLEQSAVILKSAVKSIIIAAAIIVTMLVIADAICLWFLYLDIFTDISKSL